MDVTKTVKKNHGTSLALLLVAIPAIGWVFTYDFSGLDIPQIIAVALAKTGAFAGLTMFALSLIIGNKTVLFDKLFGGLDKMYITHRAFGATSMFLLLVHPFGLYLFRLLQADSSDTLSLWFDTGNLGVLLGAVVLYNMIGIILWSIYAKVAYETFIRIHRLLGVLFVLGALHAFMTGSLLAESIWLSTYMIAVSLVATGAYISYTVFSDILHRPYSYTLISATQKADNICEVILEPKSRILRFSPGQFMYIKFNRPDMDSYHPFSIASGTTDRQLRIVVRQIGDFTKKLTSLDTGVLAQVKGPYGGFTFFDKRHKKQLWIAGGIGVTPFLARARSLPKNRGEPGDIEMIYATADKNPFGIHELETIESQAKSFNVTLFHEQQFGFVNLNLLIEHFNDVHERAIFVCGPPPLLNAVRAEAEKLGLSKQLHYEEFNY